VSSSIWSPVVLAIVLSAQEPSAPAASPSAEAALTPQQIKDLERNVLLTVSTVLLGERTYASSNGRFFDEIPCLLEPWTCIPGFPADGAPFLDPTYAWLEPRLGYARKFHPGPKAPPDAIAKARASPSSLQAFAFTATPLKPGVTGGRAFCGDSAGRMCMTADGSEPPVKDGRCEPCRKLQ
jgi:hypothetical protein